MRVHLPGRRRTDSSPNQGREVSTSAVVELSMTGWKRSPSQLMQHVHRGREAVLDLGRMEVELPFVPKDVDQDLRRLDDGASRRESCGGGGSAENRPAIGI